MVEGFQGMSLGLPKLEAIQEWSWSLMEQALSLLLPPFLSVPNLLGVQLLISLNIPPKYKLITKVGYLHFKCRTQVWKILIPKAR